MIYWSIALGFLLGSVPFGFLVARLRKVDIRQFGSGNVGATNVFRILGPGPGLLVFLLDFLKGAFAIYLAMYLGLNPLWIIMTGLAAILGHSFSPFLKFKGGRGVATGLGVLLGIAPDIFVFILIISAIIIWATRYVSVASIIGSITTTILMFVLNKPAPYSWTVFIITIVIILRHLPNIKRLLAGKELKMGSK